MKTIVVALDGSTRAPIVLRTATDLAVRTGAKLLLLRAVGVQIELPSEAWGSAPANLEKLLIRAATDELDILSREVPAAQLAGVRVDVGAPWQVVCDVAREVDADLIVIGSHGYGRLERLVGTTAAKVVNRAGRNVMVVWANAPGESA